MKVQKMERLEISSDEGSCKTVMSHICDSLDEDPNSATCVAIRRHLEECDACRDYKASIEKTIEWYREYDAPLPEGAHERLMARLGLEDAEVE
jgi:predicted anti-sigma-YlaC factor YlaD